MWRTTSLNPWAFTLNSHFIIFADNTNILFSHRDPEQIEKLINNELKKILNWFKLNKLSLNIDKTNFMII